MMKSTIKEDPLYDRKDAGRCLLDLLAPLKDYATGSGYNLGSTAALYPPKIAVMEGWSRTLWGIGSFIAGGSEYPGIEEQLSILREGVNPESPHFWGNCADRDQRFVEMAPIALCLIIAKETFWDGLNKDEQRNLYNWLSAIERYDLPQTNWHFFRIMVCLAFRHLGLPVNDKAENESFAIIESLYRGDGWYADGADGAYDLYNPMGFHYYGLVYAKLAANRDSERASLYIERARLFAPRYVKWFADNGSVIPYGRSLTYRFAAQSFFSACAFAGVEAVPWGVMKRIVLQGLRRWFSLPILDNGGILSIGYGYPNLIMADAYNSPGSPYWGLKVFLVLALKQDHPFWQAAETPLSSEPEITAEPIPNFIVSRNEEDIQLLGSGGMPDFEMNHAAQKYCKFAYSARFGFCVAHGSNGLERAAGDSMLLLSDIDSVSHTGVDYWRERGKTENKSSGQNWVSGVWRPWPEVKIVTLLVSLGYWHLRVHRIESDRKLKTAEGGFAIRRYSETGDASPPRNSSEEGAERAEAIAAYPWGASRINAIERESLRTGIIVAAAPNLNVLEPSVVIPTLMGTAGKGTTVLATAVCAGDCNNVIKAALPTVILYNDRVEIAEINDKFYNKEKQIIYLEGL